MKGRKKGEREGGRQAGRQKNTKPDFLKYQWGDREKSRAISD